MSLIVVSTLALLISISASSGAQVSAKPLNQNQVKFRRLPPKEFSAALGSSITIECEAGASPPPTIHWLKDGKRILQNDIDQNHLDDGQAIQVDDINRIALSSTRARLFIDCASFQDEAVYTCVAENSFSRISSHTKLNLIKPVPAAGISADESNNLLDLEAANLVSSNSNSLRKSELAAIPQCLTQALQGSQPEPIRIHMWTHNIVEVMKNDIVLLCRSNVSKKQQQSLEAETRNNQSQPSSNLSSNSENLNKQQESTSKKQTVTWTTPDDKLVSVNDRSKFEILETGDLLIKDLRWDDMGSYICTVSDEQSSDSVSAFVYPAAIKAKSKRALMGSRY